MLAQAAIYTATLWVLFTGHAPTAGGVNGPNCYRQPWQLCFQQTGTAACHRFPVGTLLYMPAWVADYGLPAVIRCAGGAPEGVDVDLAWVSEDYPARADTAAANRWGRQYLQVQVVWPNGPPQTVAPPAPARPTRAAAPARRPLTAREQRVLDRMEVLLWPALRVSAGVPLDRWVAYYWPPTLSRMEYCGSLVQWHQGIPCL